ncbi:hypothetical protein [Stenotrophomonas rhizophila]|uniref:hypothetical protein n=1 Tax=Stenotrophomonas rhizophila TaxID=216778 RepID=UPI0011A92DA9|nr:hypothetical protein [Stenotrophomonas rhizophila]
MKINVDFSVSTSGGEAIGNVVGDLDFAVEPMIGDTISLMCAPTGSVIPGGHESGGLLKVDVRIISPGQGQYPLAIMLSDMVAGTREQAVSLMSYLEAEFGLQANFYDH